MEISTSAAIARTNKNSFPKDSLIKANSIPPPLRNHMPHPSRGIVHIAVIARDDMNMHMIDGLPGDDEDVAFAADIDELRASQSTGNRYPH